MMEISVLLTYEQVEQLANDPESELVVYYPDGTKVLIRVTDELLGESQAVH